jgi:hypothetical protein
MSASLPHLGHRAVRQRSDSRHSDTWERRIQAGRRSVEPEERAERVNPVQPRGDTYLYPRSRSVAATETSRAVASLPIYGAEPVEASVARKQQMRQMMGEFAVREARPAPAQTVAPGGEVIFIRPGLFQR